MDEKKRGKVTDAELEAERRKAAEQLWSVKDPNDPRHKQLEGRYNELEKERFTRQGNNPADYKYKHDARHEFEFKEDPATGEKTATMAKHPDGSEYHLRKSDEVINWRKDTEIGKKESLDAQRDVGRGGGDDAGHLIGAQFGADPADKRNLTRQELVQNENGAFHAEEMQTRKEVDGGRRCGIEVKVNSAGERSYRTAETYDLSADGRRIRDPKKEKEQQDHQVLYGDFPNAATRGGSRAEVYAHAKETRAAVANTSDEERRQWAQQARRDPSSVVIKNDSPRRPPPGYTSPDAGPKPPEKTRGGR